VTASESVAPARPTDCMHAIAAGRALPVASMTVTPRAIAAFSASTVDGSTRLLLLRRVPSMSQANNFTPLPGTARRRNLATGEISAAAAAAGSAAVDVGPAKSHCSAKSKQCAAALRLRVVLI